MKLFYRKTGNGKPLIIVHGLYGSSDNWLSIGKKLSGYYTVYMIDQRNHGRSPHADENSYEDMRNDLVEFIDGHKIGKATILGHSMGGKVAMFYAADYPERIEKLIVADIAPKDYLLMNEASQFQLHRNILLAMQDIDFAQINSRNEVADILAEKIDNLRIRQFLLKNITKNEHSGKLQWRLNPGALYAYLDEIVSGVNKQWLADRIPIVAYPATFIRGEKSNYISSEDKTLIKEIYPEAKIIDIPDAGHWLHAEQPELFIKAVLQFN
ncbi:MAG: alpha/beta fold hydrolase [Chlorobi bacterium]|nr:alpha/beta fold hydrolase [Chlorobiota bacterium]